MPRNKTQVYIDLDAMDLEIPPQYFLKLLQNFAFFARDSRNKGAFLVGTSPYFEKLTSSSLFRIDRRPLMEVVQDNAKKRLNGVLVFTNPANLPALRTVFDKALIFCIPPINYDLPNLDFEASNVCYYPPEYIIGVNQNVAWWKMIAFFYGGTVKEMKEKSWNSLEEYLAQQKNK